VKAVACANGRPPLLQGNWTAVSGVIQMSKTLDLLQLTDIKYVRTRTHTHHRTRTRTRCEKTKARWVVSSIIGRAVVLHAGEDDCAQPTGHAGNFLAVGVIGIPNVADNAATSTHSKPRTRTRTAAHTHAPPHTHRRTRMRH
jgi:hypothetical protein